jgi:RNA polymerase sigma factor (sigma-70 family)
MDPSAADTLARLTSFVREHERQLVALAWRCLAIRGHRPSAQDLEDVLSDAYLTAATRLRNEPTLRPADVGPWFRKVLFFRCLNHARRWGREVVPDGWAALVAGLQADDVTLEELLPAPASDPNKQLLLDQLLAKLEPDARTVIQLALSGYTADEIAAQIGSTAANVRKLRSRGLAKLREALERREDEK